MMIIIDSEQKFDHMMKEMEKVSKRFGEIFLGDFLVGGLIVSGIFLIIDSLGLDSIAKLVAGIIILTGAIGLLFHTYMKRLAYAAAMGKIKDEWEPIVTILKLVDALKKSPENVPLLDTFKLLSKLLGQDLSDFIDDKSD